MTDVPEYGSPEADEVDWFGGDSTAFDSGEDLAAALFGMAGVQEPASGAPGTLDNDEALDDPFEWGPGNQRPGPSGEASVPRESPWRSRTSSHSPATSPLKRPAWTPDASPTPPAAWPRAMPPRTDVSTAANLPQPPATAWQRPGQAPPPSPRVDPRSVPQTTSWGVREYGQTPTNGSGEGTSNEYGIRHGVRMLRMAENSMDKLRITAVEVTWAAAALAVAQGAGVHRPRH